MRTLLLGALAAPALLGPARASDLALRRVMLSSAGVGYFEYEAEVDGDATLSLDVPLDQVDDVLTSLVVFDNQGAVGTVRVRKDPELRSMGRRRVPAVRGASRISRKVSTSISLRNLHLRTAAGTSTTANGDQRGDKGKLRSVWK